MKRYFIILSLLAVAISGTAQQFRPYADERPIHFGFLLGVNIMDYKITPSELEIEGGVYDVRCASLMPGFSAGFLTDIRICKYLNFRVTPTLHFGTKTLQYKLLEGTTSLSSMQTSILNIPISIPVYLKWSSLRYNNFRPYVIFGGGVQFDLGASHDRAVMQKRFDAFVEVGFGCDIYLELFNLAPELKLAIGFPNQITPFEERPELSIPESPYTRAIDKMTTRMITLCFNFE